jgi:hypothetical protein
MKFRSFLLLACLFLVTVSAEPIVVKASSSVFSHELELTQWHAQLTKTQASSQGIDVYAIVQTLFDHFHIPIEAKECMNDAKGMHRIYIRYLYEQREREYVCVCV